MSKEEQSVPDQESDEKEMYLDTTEYKLIYIYWIDDNVHKGLLKIGDASLRSPKTFDCFPNNCSELNKAARKRIGEQTGTAGIMYHLCHTEIAVKKKGQYIEAFRDKAVHKVLENSGIKKMIISVPGGRATEWFQVNLDTAKNAIAACKQGRQTLLSSEIVPEEEREIILREEQEDAIKKTIACFKDNSQMLWNAKMRYGKTATSLTFVKRELKKYPKTIIITHRPVVESGWREDFNVVFKKHECLFLTKDKESEYSDDTPQVDQANERQLKKAEHDGKPFIYFASIQDLRGSKRVGGKFNKNNAVFDLDWDLIINDEAHEGTQTDLGLKVSEALKKPNTKLLSLSGTPFNIINQFDDDSVYTWDYPMEQAKKREWDSLHPGDPNPYADLPQMHIYTYDLGDLIKGYSPELEDKAFNFTEFFRTWTGDAFNDEKALPSDAAIGDFMHKNDVRHFLDLITTPSNDSAYPFSTPQYRDMFHHTLWMVPGVKEAKALEAMLREHPIFKNFKVANVAGEGDYYEETHYDNALDKVKTAIKENDYTITLSCGKLTTGVTVREWTACFMLSGSYSTGASSYLQTIFRVQSPGQINGKTKEHSYVFDFAPDRTLMVLAEAAKVSRKGGSGGNCSDERNREAMKNFLNFCPVISIKGTMMKPYSVDSMMEQLKRVYADRAIRTGFDDASIYNERLLTLDSLDIKEFEELKKIIGSSKAQKLNRAVVMNDQGFTQEEYEQQKQLKNKPRAELTEEQKEELVRLKKQKEERGKAISILRGISVRMPLLIYGADVPFEEDITINRFVDIVDDESWKEFMPDKVTKDMFLKFTKYYDRDVFIAAGKEIRRLAKRADSMLPTQRVQSITKLFSYFKNPDKETVLTPWRVVNLHMGDCLGGYDFWNDNHDETVEEPRFIDQGEVTQKTLANPEAKILEINSKTGLYPLYVAYSIYRAKCKEHQKELSEELQQRLWYETVQNNVFVICKTEMAKYITKRTLLGYKRGKLNAHYFDDLINQFKNKSDQVVKKILNRSYWGVEGIGNMKFDAVVGNPPYQEQYQGDSNGANPVYHLFIDVARQLCERGTFIHPARFLFNVGKTPKEWNERILNDKHFKIIQYWQSSFDLFPTVDIKGGVAISAWNKDKIIKPIKAFYPYEELFSIIEKIKATNFTPFSNIVAPVGIYRLTDDLYSENLWAQNRPSIGHKYDVTSNVFEVFPELFFDEKPMDGFDYIKIYGRKNNSRTIQWIKKNYVKVPENFGKYKVFIAKANGSGILGEVLSFPVIGEPLEGHTFTFLSIGSFDSKEEANACLKYISTKFTRIVLGSLKPTQDNLKETWANVPMQCFSTNSDIDWAQSLHDIDQQLFVKYGLADNEIAFIEDKAIPME